MSSDFSLEVFDWNQIEQAKSLGVGSIELADIEPFEAMERTIKLAHQKHGESGEIRVRLLFTPEIIARTRKNTSTFSTAGRAMTQIGGLPLGAGKGVLHGVGKVGDKVGGIFGKGDHSKQESIPIVNAEDPPSEQVSGPVGSANGVNSVDFAQKNQVGGTSESRAEPGTLKVTLLNAKDLVAPDGDTPKPYVVARVGEKEHKTKHAGKSAAPEW